jgi:hypothetical protein
MGWIETPQIKNGIFNGYAKPMYETNAPTYFLEPVLALPHLDTFCSPTINNCDPTSSNPCPADSSACWWHGHAVVSDMDCTDHQCAYENRTYGSAAVEPSVDRVYDRSCDQFTGSLDSDRDTSKPVTVVYTLPDPGLYNLGCATQANGGKFTIRGGNPTTTTEPYPQIDLHQLGAGYEGHIWFSHAYGSTNAAKHQLVGTWSPDLPLASGQSGKFDIVVHLPSHGGEYDVEYLIKQHSLDLGEATCALDQSTWTIPFTNGTDEWRYIGAYDLQRGARVQLANIYDDLNGSTDDGEINVAWDAMAFVPIGANAGHGCDDDYE